MTNLYSLDLFKLIFAGERVNSKEKKSEGSQQWSMDLVWRDTFWSLNYKLFCYFDLMFYMSLDMFFNLKKSWCKTIVVNIKFNKLP